MSEAIVFIPLTKGKVTVIDFDDFEKVRQSKWHAKQDRDTFYAARTIRLESGKRKTQKLHQFLVPGFPQVDHINHDKLDNRKQNLRGCTGSQNQHNSKTRADNTSGFKGAYKMAGYGRWLSKIYFNKTQIYLGNFPTVEEAARAYDAAAKHYYGEFARLNFPGNNQLT